MPFLESFYNRNKKQEARTATYGDCTSSSLQSPVVNLSPQLVQYSNVFWEAINPVPVVAPAAFPCCPVSVVAVWSLARLLGWDGSWNKDVLPMPCLSPSLSRPCSSNPLAIPIPSCPVLSQVAHSRPIIHPSPFPPSQSSPVVHSLQTGRLHRHSREGGTP